MFDVSDDFVGAMGYNFAQTFDRTAVREGASHEHSDAAPPDRPADATPRRAAAV
jgi:hypothetical protein